MPCTYTGSLEGDHIMAMEEELKRKRKKARKVKEELDSLTRMLCRTCEILEGLGHVAKIAWPSDVATWWEKHKSIDEKRIQEEKRQKAAEERAAKVAAAKKIVAEKKEYVRLHKKYGGKK